MQQRAFDGLRLRTNLPWPVERVLCLFVPSKREMTGGRVSI